MSSQTAAIATGARVTQDHKPGFVQLVLGLILLILIATLALTARQPQMPAIAEFAPQVNHLLTDAPPEQAGTFGGGAAGGEGGILLPSPLPLPSPAAEGRRFVCPGIPPRQIEDPQSPPCVSQFSGDNGGATSKGVTRDLITIYVPLPTFQADGTEQATVQAFERFFNDRFEFYGRRIHLVLDSNAGVDASSAGQQATATHADKDVQAFASTFYDFAGGSEYYPALAQHQIIGSMGNFEMQYDAKNLQRLSPYIWSYLMSADQEFANFGDWTCQRLAGRNAVHAPDPALAAQPRKFGVIYDPTTTQDPLNMPDLQVLLNQLKTCNINPVLYKGDDENGNVTSMQAQGVNSLICMCNWLPMVNMQEFAKSKGYLPEWLVSSFENNDYSFYYHIAAVRKVPGPYPGTFGLIFRPRQVAPPAEPFYQALVSEGYNDATNSDFIHVWSRRELYRSLLLIASGIQMAGPHLTPQSFADGLHRTIFPNPPAATMPGKVGFNGNSYSMTLDGAEWWWSDSAQSPYPGDSAGTMCYVDGGARHTFGNWPQGGDPFFSGTCDGG